MRDSKPTPVLVAQSGIDFLKRCLSEPRPSNFWARVSDDFFRQILPPFFGEHHLATLIMVQEHPEFSALCKDLFARTAGFDLDGVIRDRILNMLRSQTLSQFASAAVASDDSADDDTRLLKLGYSPSRYAILQLPKSTKFDWNIRQLDYGFELRQSNEFNELSFVGLASGGQHGRWECILIRASVDGGMTVMGKASVPFGSYRYEGQECVENACTRWFSNLINQYLAPMDLKTRLDKAGLSISDVAR